MKATRVVKVYDFCIANEIVHVYKIARYVYCVSGVTDSFSDSLKHLNAVRKRSVVFVLCPCVSGNSVSAVNVLISGYWCERAVWTV